MQIYDFDRCTGELSNFLQIDFSAFIPFPPYGFNPFVLSLDANNIYMERSNLNTMTSYQNIQVDVETGQMTVVADSVYVPCLTPNLKWVVPGYQEVPFTPIDGLNVFTQPNNLGNVSGRRNNLYYLPVAGFIIEPPEWANHLLGPIDGTICDSLGLNDDLAIKKKDEFTFTVFPNPENDALHIKTNLSGPLRLIIRNAHGMQLFESDFNKTNFSLSNELVTSKAGIYFWKFPMR